RVVPYGERLSLCRRVCAGLHQHSELSSDALLNPATIPHGSSLPKGQVSPELRILIVRRRNSPFFATNDGASRPFNAGLRNCWTIGTKITGSLQCFFQIFEKWRLGAIARIVSSCRSVDRSARHCRTKRSSCRVLNVSSVTVTVRFDALYALGRYRDHHHDHEQQRTNRREQAEGQSGTAGELDQRYEDRIGVRKRDMRLS